MPNVSIKQNLISKLKEGSGIFFIELIEECYFVLKEDKIRIAYAKENEFMWTDRTISGIYRNPNQIQEEHFSLYVFGDCDVKIPYQVIKDYKLLSSLKL